MFVSVIFSVMFKFFGHIHSVMLNRSNDYSSFFNSKISKMIFPFYAEKYIIYHSVQFSSVQKIYLGSNNRTNSTFYVWVVIIIIIEFYWKYYKCNRRCGAPLVILILLVSFQHMLIVNCSERYVSFWDRHIDEILDAII